MGERIPYQPAVADYQTLSLERDPSRPEVLHVWLDRPRRRNAVNARMMSEVGDVFEALQRDFDTRVVVLGCRGLSFCSGADRKADDAPLEPPRSEREVRWRAHLGRRVARAIEDCDIPTVARVQGPYRESRSESTSNRRKTCGHFSRGREASPYRSLALSVETNA